jgi:hypothetical protein
VATPPARLTIVDAANVIGARPDGWWRDKPAAVRRLLAALSRASAPDEDLVVVLEGGGRQGVASGEAGGVTVVHAPGSGDEEIVRLVAAAEPDRPTTVVTADRELRGRVAALGADTVGPRTLWERLDAAGGAPPAPRPPRGP